jgi:tRNA modification GTPase
MTGDSSLEVLEKVFKGSIDFENKKLTYGHIINEEKIVDEVLAVYMKAPNTYTREDVVEIYTHGGVVAVREVLDTLLKNGANLAEPGEFTKRAFLNGRLDLAQAEAVLDLIDANTSMSYENSLNQLEGSLSRTVENIEGALIEVMASTVAEIDFPEDEIDTLSDYEKINKLKPILDDIESLLKSSKRGKVLREGIKTLILGRPNVGKSSLLNALLKENRAIVTDIPGTTRDTIEEVLDLDGIPLNLIDTAGIRETEDTVELIGVEKAKSQIENADLVLVLLDSSEELSTEDVDILEYAKDKEKIVIINKTDLEAKLDLDKLKDYKYIMMSIVDGTGIDELQEEIKRLFFEDKITSSDDIMVSNIRHIEALRRASTSLQSAIGDLEVGVPLDLVEVDLNICIDELGNITGKTTTEDVLDRIFSEFCIGK